jgi:serine protein kinase
MDKNIEDLSGSIKQRFVDNESIKSFPQFLQDVKSSPSKYLRNSAQYLQDVFHHYGSYPVRDITGEEIPRWGLFDLQPVFGQERAQNTIYSYINSFADNRVNKIVILHGPNGSAKTSLVASMMKGMEEYSKTSDGSVYTFNWIFSDVGEKETNIGFGKSNTSYDCDTLAFIRPEDVSFKLACSMKDNPILLIPVKERKKFLKSLGVKNPPKYLLEAELCQKCHEIYSKLAISYGGDWSKIVRHVQVERFYLSKRFRKGLISIDPQVNRDANSRPLNVEQSYRIPPVLSLSSMHEPFGDLVDANRGVVEFSEIFKRSVEANKYLLTTAQWGTISLPSFTAYLDCVIFATDNQTQLSLFKRELDWPSFNGRFAYVRVPYNLKLSDETKTCSKLISDHVKSIIAPHSTEILALWSILTRLRQSDKLLASSLTYVEKAMLYDKEEAPTSWKTKDKQVILKDLKEIATEYDEEQSRVIAKSVKDASYEGRSGASYRELETIIISCANKQTHLSPTTIFKAIEEMIKDESVYEFTRLYRGNREESVDNILYEKGYLEPHEILFEIKLYYAEKIWKDLRKAASLISEEEYTKLFNRYLNNVKAWIQGEKIPNPKTGHKEDASEALMGSVEEKLSVPTKESESFRHGIFNKIASWKLDNQEETEIPYVELFSDSLDSLRKNINKDHEEKLEKLAENILYFNSEDWQLVNEEDKVWIVQTIDNLKDLGYTEPLLKEAIVFIINEIQK